MNRSWQIAAVVLALLASGCASAYTSITKVDDSTYLIARNKQGLFSASGSLWSCKKITELKMACFLAGEP